MTLPGNKPVISSGPPGYSAVSGHRVTVFGCTGFLGRYLVSKLGACGWCASVQLLTLLPQEKWARRSSCRTARKTRRACSNPWGTWVRSSAWSVVASAFGVVSGLFRVHVIGVGYARREYGSRVPEALGHGVQSRWERLRNQVSAPFFPPPPFFLRISRLTGWLVHEGTLTSGRRTPLVQRGLPRSLRSVASRSSSRSHI